MQEIEITDPYRNKPTFYKYDSADRQLLVDLLNEYSGKLTSICQEVESKQRQSINRAKIVFRLKVLMAEVIFNLLIVIDILIAIAFICYIVITREQFFSLQSIKWIELLLFAFFFIMISLAVFLFPRELEDTEVDEYKVPKQTTRTVDLLTQDANRIALKLEKVMRVTLEVQDAIEINLARKLELDLRIADAESALSYYHSVLKSEPV